MKLLESSKIKENTYTVDQDGNLVIEHTKIITQKKYMYESKDEKGRHSKMMFNRGYNRFGYCEENLPNIGFRIVEAYIRREEI